MTIDPRERREIHLEAKEQAIAVVAEAIEEAASKCTESTPAKEALNLVLIELFRRTG